MNRLSKTVVCTVVPFFAVAWNTCLAEELLRSATVSDAMRRAAEFYRTQVAVQGGYVYYYSVDLTKRWGEGSAGATKIWVQPPGTPTVGLAYLKAYRATGDEYYLGAAREAAEALVYGQLSSGGWTNSIDCQPRTNGHKYSGGRRRLDGNSSLDDGQTQSAIQLLVLVDEALEFEHEGIHQSVTLALDSLLAAQFPNGGFPQVWTKPVSPQPVLKASYPQYDWRTDGRVKNYWDMYTINDNVCGHVAETLIVAARVYKGDKFNAALCRLGEFLILAQMPKPQPAWAQQYNYQMHPMWARRFEPPAISGSESQEVIETLMAIYRATGDARYLKPIEPAIAYLRQSTLPDGRLARYYELQSNRPLYMQRNGKEYKLTYDDSRLPKHYGWKIDAKLDELEMRLRDIDLEKTDKIGDSLVQPAEVSRIVKALDEQGRWINRYAGESLVGQPKFEEGREYISSAEFARNMTVLSEHLAALAGE